MKRSIIFQLGIILTATIAINSTAMAFTIRNDMVKPAITTSKEIVSVANDLSDLQLSDTGTSTLLFEDSKIVMESFFETTPLSITEAGNYVVQLTDFEFPAPFMDLGASISTSTELLGSIETSGSFDFYADTGNYFLSLFGKTDEERMFGQYGINISLGNENYSPVPVPSALLLFGSGLLGFVGMKRKRVSN